MMLCLRCNYPIGGVATPVCPECGLTFNRFVRTSYRLEGDDRLVQVGVRKGIIWLLLLAPWFQALTPYMSWKYVAVTTGQVPSPQYHPGLIGGLLQVPWMVSVACGCFVWSGPVALWLAYRLGRWETWVRLRERRAWWIAGALGYFAVLAMYFFVYRPRPEIMEWWLD